MIGREQKECTVGGGETSWSRGADGVSQTDISVLTHWWLKTAAGAWCGPGYTVNNIRYYLWTLVVSLSDSQKQQASLSWCRLHTIAPTLKEEKTTGFHCVIQERLLHLLLCLCSSYVCSHPLLYWFRCVRKVWVDGQHMTEETSWYIIILDDFRVLPEYTHPPICDDSVV